MKDMSRRRIVRRLAGAAAGVLVTSGVRGHESPSPPAPTPGGDDPRRDLSGGLGGMMFVEQVTFKTDPAVMELRITSTPTGPGDASNPALIRRGAAAVVRLDAAVDDFTRQGGVYWACGKAEGKFQFKAPTETALVVRDHDGTVTCYALGFDLRC